MNKIKNLPVSILPTGQSSLNPNQKIGSKTYTYSEITTEKRCANGVVAKPGIATGSRSKIEGLDK